MQFTKLRLTGFKSFVEPTDFEIRPGLTGIVGPNGCGKSNLLEALRWVMGATSAKALRAGGMEDVIFAGSGAEGRPGRPARNWAEVMLTVSNEDRTAPPQFNDHPTLEITRRITRKADGASSTYRINGKEVRAKDVQLLFADASSGANSPALVRQGQVADLINAKPENRRKFLEEAAGITGLYTRRHEAELRLKAASQNLERLDDVTGELEQQRGQLSRQARQASRYRNIAGHLKRTEALLAYVRLTDATEAAAEAEEKLKAARETLEQAVVAATSAGTAREKAHEALEPLRQKEAEAAAALHRLTVEQENFDKELDRAKKDIERLTQEKERLEREAARERDLGGDAASALEQIAKEEEALKLQAPDDRARLEAADREVEQTSAALSEAEAIADEAQKKLSEARAARQTLEATLNRATRAVNEAESDVSKLTNEFAAFEAQAGTGDLDAARTALNAAQEAATEAETNVTALAGRKAETDEAMRAAEAPRTEAASAVSALQGQVDTLSRVLAASEPDGESLLEAVTVAEGYEAAFAAAMEDGIEAPSDEEASRHWSALGADAAGAPLPAGATPLTAHVQAPDVLNRRLSSVGVATADTAAHLAAQLSQGQMIVSPDGGLWRWDGFVAQPGAKSAAAVRLEQKRELDALKAALDEAFTARDAAEQAFGDAKANAAAVASEIAAAQSALKQAERDAIEKERKVAQLSAEQERRAARGEALLSRIEETKARLSRAREERAEIEAKTGDLPNIDSLDRTLQQAVATREDARRSSGRARGQRADLKRDVDGRAARLRQLGEQRDAWHKRASTATERIEQVARSLAETEASLAKATALPGVLLERKDAIYEAVDAAESRRRVAADEYAALQRTLADTERAAKDADEQAAMAREERARTEAVAEAARAKLADETARARETLDGEEGDLLTIAEHKEGQPIPSPAVLEEKIDKLKREREALGGVNLCADQEMAEIDERLAEIQTERADCEAAIAKLRGAIGTLNRDGRQRLRDAFDTVNTNFSQLFVELFGGGSAELRLVDSDDPLDAGLEIFAQPPGKKLTSLSLMSGGEQALTATALIFAVFKANPAPVCVLDEVDAPLDDANTDRFCAMLSKMAKETDTRFISITHHPLTMSRMDRLFGVTMIERGVSQLVSVDLSEAEKMAA